MTWSDVFDIDIDNVQGLWNDIEIKVVNVVDLIVPLI